MDKPTVYLYHQTAVNESLTKQGLKNKSKKLCKKFAGLEKALIFVVCY